MRMEWLESLILGAVQGLTEFLPISSDVHLTIVQRAVGGGEPVLRRDAAPRHARGDRPLFPGRGADRGAGLARLDGGPPRLSPSGRPPDRVPRLRGDAAARP